MFGIAMVVTVAGGLTGEPDGRSYSSVIHDSAGQVIGGSGGGPYPGWTYGVPLILGCVVVLAAAEGVLVLIARRPAVVGVSAEWDLRLRRFSSARVLRGAQLLIAATAAGMLQAAGMVLQSVGSNASLNGEPAMPQGTIGVVITLAGAAIAIAAFAVLLFAPTVPVRARVAKPTALSAAPVSPDRETLTAHGQQTNTVNLA